MIGASSGNCTVSKSFQQEEEKKNAQNSVNSDVCGSITIHRSAWCDDFWRDGDKSLC
jgi:hypothetical protein